MNATGRKKTDKRFGFELFEYVRDDGRVVWVSVPAPDRQPEPVGSGWCLLLQKLIKDSPLTTYGIAIRAGVPVQTVDRIVAGSEPKLGTVEKLAPILGLHLAFDQPIIDHKRTKRARK